tara:strand:- start:7003 stop:7173 length:171 start_codon:yes stop_codon:yes gene_type:complete
MGLTVDIGAFLASLYLVTQALDKGFTLLAVGAFCVGLYFVLSAFYDMITANTSLLD